MVSERTRQSDHSDALQIQFPKKNEAPDVSIIIPVFGQLQHTLHCLEALSRHESHFRFEVIVVDDCSPDETPNVVSKIPGLKYARSSENQGFILSCNKGAKLACGKYLVFLNNDTEVLPNWLNELIETFSTHPQTGYVGSKLLYPDGSLQEAGGIIWQNGSVWNFGRDGDPMRPEFNYVRSVDFCSGASVAIPRNIFEELGGFDQEYLPAYCEDVDLAFKIHSLGLKVLYQPFSEVIHLEGGTGGKDLTQGAKAYQIPNLEKLRRRWKNAITQFLPPTRSYSKNWDRNIAGRALLISADTPALDRDAGSSIIIDLLQILKDLNFKSTFIPNNFKQAGEYTTYLQKLGVECCYSPYVNSVEEHLINTGDAYDVIFIFRAGMFEKYGTLLHKYCPSAKIIFHTVDLHYLRLLRQAAAEQNDQVLARAQATKHIELEAINIADQSIIVSEKEYELLRNEIANPRLSVISLPMEMNPGSGKPFDERKDILFIGGFIHQPNIDAVTYFVRDVFPLVQKRIPEIKFHIVGSDPPEVICALANENINVAGHVKDLNPYLHSCRLSVAPLRYGAGVKGKIVTSLASGLPCVGTNIAMEGMGLIDKESCLIADKAEEMAEMIYLLYSNEPLWQKLSDNGYRAVREHFSKEAVHKKWLELFETLGILANLNVV